jgi:hypothetical protein
LHYTCHFSCSGVSTRRGGLRSARGHDQCCHHRLRRHVRQQAPGRHHLLATGSAASECVFEPSESHMRCLALEMTRIASQARSTLLKQLPVWLREPATSRFRSNHLARVGRLARTEVLSLDANAKPRPARQRVNSCAARDTATVQEIRAGRPSHSERLGGGPILNECPRMHRQLMALGSDSISPDADFLSATMGAFPYPNGKQERAAAQPRPVRWQAKRTGPPSGS